ncbi:hypothetical protein ACVBEF_07885 [Glaciimonas sp. GG7]
MQSPYSEPVRVFLCVGGHRKGWFAALSDNLNFNAETGLHNLRVIVRSGVSWASSVPSVSHAS